MSSPNPNPNPKPIEQAVAASSLPALDVIAAVSPNPAGSPNNFTSPSSLGSPNWGPNSPNSFRQPSEAQSPNPWSAATSSDPALAKYRWIFACGRKLRTEERASLYEHFGLGVVSFDDALHAQELNVAKFPFRVLLLDVTQKTHRKYLAKIAPVAYKDPLISLSFIDRKSSCWNSGWDGFDKVRFDSVLKEIPIGIKLFETMVIELGAVRLGALPSLFGRAMSRAGPILTN